MSTNFEQIQQDFQAYLDAYQPSGKPDTLYQPIRYAMASGGKRLRPLMVLIACDAVGGDYREAMPAALAVEVFHNFTLVHDDIMDDATTRRGEPTVFHRYGLNDAILSGDAMMIEAYRLLGELPRAVQADVFACFSAMGKKLCEGQQMDMDFETMESVSEEEYKTMVHGKTTILLECALEIGALVGGAAQKQIELLKRFAFNAGLAFQMQDDWLDTFGEQAAVGKRIGGDILQQKKTLLYIYSIAALEESALAAFDTAWTSANEESVQYITQTMADCGAKGQLEGVISDYKAQADDILESLENDAVDVKNLRLVLEKLVLRKF